MGVAAVGDSRMHLTRMIAVGFAWAVSISTSATALTFNITTAPGASLSTAQASAFGTAAAAWSALLTDPIAVNLQVGFLTLGQNILGSTTLNFVVKDTSSVVAALGGDATSASDAKAVASLLAQPPPNGTILLTTAQAKALGYSQTGIDATIEFSSSYQFATSRNSDGSTPQGFYDLIGVAEHEIGHALGFVSSFDLGGAVYTPTLLDEFRYTAQNARATSTGSAFYSLNNGAASIASFSTGGVGQYQASHWLQGTGGLMDPAVAAGVSQNITALDLQALDIIGYNLPEPGSIMIVLLGVAGAALVRRRPVLVSRF